MTNTEDRIFRTLFATICITFAGGMLVALGSVITHEAVDFKDLGTAIDVDSSAGGFGHADIHKFTLSDGTKIVIEGGLGSTTLPIPICSYMTQTYGGRFKSGPYYGVGSVCYEND